MVEAAPLLGDQLNLVVRGGPDMGANGLLRWYLAHVLLVPALLIIFTGVHYYKVIIHGHSLPPQKEEIGEDTAKRVPLDKRVYFIPDVLTLEMMWIAVTTFVLTVLAIWFFKAPLESHADPQNTPLHTLAPWYFLWIQGALKLGDKVFWGIVFPGLVFGFLAVIPYIDVTPSRRFADRRFAMSVCYVLLAALIVFTYWGLPTVGVATSGDIEVLAEMIPGEHAGVLRPLPTDQLQPGIYTTAQLHGSDPIAALAEFDEELDHTYAVMVERDGVMVEEETSLRNELTNVLNNVNLYGLPGTIAFSPVPADAPELEHALEEMEYYIEDFDDLVNSYGVIAIRQDQANVWRADVIVTWEVTDEETGEVTRSFNSDYTYIHENSEWFGH